MNCDLSPLEPGNVRFEECVFEDCKIVKWFCFDADFVDCSFPNTSLRETTFSALSGVWRNRRNEIRNNDFRSADLEWTSFINGVDLSAQQWPTDQTVVILTDIQARIAWAVTQVQSWSDDAKRKAARHELETVTFREGLDQQDLFVHRGTAAQYGDLALELFELLERAPV